MSKEMFDIVDEDDDVKGKATRSEVHDKGHLHRSVMFFVFDKQKRVFVNQRTAKKDFYNEFWSIVFGGHVSAGETYDQAITREIPEETGLHGKPFPITLFKKRFDNRDKENCKLYGIIADQELRLNKDEIKQGSFITLEEIEHKMKQEKFLPETDILLPILRDFISKERE